MHLVPGKCRIESLVEETVSSKEISMVYYPVGICSLAVSFPSIRRTNAYYWEKYPELVDQAEQTNLAKLFSLDGVKPDNELELEMLPYLSDPFRGTVERWILGPDESSLTLEYRAACNALSAVGMAPNDVDLMIVASILPEQIGLGNAAFLARQLGFQGAAWNLDGTCGSAPLALQTACALVRAGEYRHVLVVVSCTYSRVFDENDTLFWPIGDGAGAFIVSSLALEQGVLGTKTIHTGVLCDIISVKPKPDPQGNQWARLRPSILANKIMCETAGDIVRTCCKGAAIAASVTLDQIDFFLFNAATAWFTSFCVRILGIAPERTINFYPQYANIGATLTAANLYYAAQMGKIRENDLVLVYGFGAAGVASAMVMRWGNVAFGPSPISSVNLSNTP